MPYISSVPRCNGNYKSGPKVNIFAFPNDAELKEKWIRAIKRKDFIPTKNSREIMEFDEPQLPSVTNINMRPSEENQELKMDGVNVFHVDHPLECSNITIGSLEFNPRSPLSYVPVYLSRDGIAFEVRIHTNPQLLHNVVITARDVECMQYHLSNSLKIIFIYITKEFFQCMKTKIQMSEDDYGNFDPDSKDVQQKPIILWVKSISKDQEEYLRYGFSGGINIKEIDHETTSQILVKWLTPRQHDASVIEFHPEDTATTILVYPPPPKSGGIAVTSKDTSCLNEGAYLNDTIIDFYLKYVFEEKLSDYDREKTHVFSSYFYSRLTKEPEKQPGNPDDGQNTIQFKRHSQVKTWTRRVDIFSKDYIIIPINQNAHWFLAIICFPSRVPDAPPNVPAKSDAKVSKSAANVASTDDQDDSVKTTTNDGQLEGNSQTKAENSTNSSSSSLYEVKEPPNSEEPSPESSDRSTRPDGSHISQRLETPCICIFDSLIKPHRWKIATTLREYLDIEWKMKKRTRKIFDCSTMQEYIIRCPQQRNLHDCGVYLLQYFENFFQNPITYFGNPMPNLSNWFTEEIINQKRQQIKELILHLQKKQEENCAIKH